MGLIMSKIVYVPFMIEDHVQSCPICIFDSYKNCNKFIELMNEYGHMIEYGES